MCWLPSTLQNKEFHKTDDRNGARGEATYHLTLWITCSPQTSEATQTTPPLPGTAIRRSDPGKPLTCVSSVRKEPEGTHLHITPSKWESVMKTMIFFPEYEPSKFRFPRPCALKREDRRKLLETEPHSQKPLPGAAAGRAPLSRCPQQRSGWASRRETRTCGTPQPEHRAGRTAEFWGRT